jgi:ABC-type polysaccharide/polyol phosphate export permease
MTEAMSPTYDSKARRSPIADEIRELLRYRFLIVHMVKRNVTSRYKRSILGITWTLLDPLLSMVVMAIVYSALFRASIDDFPVFLLAGILVYDYFSQSTAQAMTEMMYSGSLISRVYMPKSVFGVSATGTGMVNFLIALLPLFVFSVLFARPITPALFFLPVALLIITMFTLGVGLMMSSFAVFFADMLNIYTFGLRLGLFLSGIFYYVDQLPVELQTVVRLMPTYHMIRLVRDPVYEGILPRWEIIVYAIIWAVMMLLVGFWIFTRYSDEFAYKI